MALVALVLPVASVALVALVAHGVFQVIASVLVFAALATLVLLARRSLRERGRNELGRAGGAGPVSGQRGVRVGVTHSRMTQGRMGMSDRRRLATKESRLPLGLAPAVGPSGSGTLPLGRRGSGALLQSLWSK